MAVVYEKREERVGKWKWRDEKRKGMTIVSKRTRYLYLTEALHGDLLTLDRFVRREGRRCLLQTVNSQEQQTLAVKMTK